MGQITAPNREAWLLEVTNSLRPAFEAEGRPLPTPDRLFVSVGFPSQRALSTRNRVIGQCWTPKSEDDERHVFISPTLADPTTIVATLVHELVHAALPKDAGHKAEFRRLATAMGLEGKMTATTPGPKVVALTETLLKQIGEPPHVALDPKQIQLKKQTTRMLKAACPDCGYVIRVSNRWATVGLPFCCNCAVQLELAE